jgi:polar amino acid transport system substrate-binding protein
MIRLFGLQCLIGLALAGQAHAFKFVASENPPFAYWDPAAKARPGGAIEPTGLAVDLALAMAKRAQIPVSQMMIFPLSRAIQIAQSDSDTCVFPLVRNQEREALFQWVGPFSKNYWSFYARSDFKGRIVTLDDARKYRIGSGDKSAKTTYLAERGFQMDLSADEALNAVKLERGRFDLWLIGLYEGRIFADAAGISNIKPVFIVKQVDFYMGCNLATPKGLIDKLQGAYQSLRDDGTVEAITAPYERKFNFPAMLTK